MKIVPQIDKYPRLVDFGQSAVGKAALISVFAVGLCLNHVKFWVDIAAIAALMAYMPARRRLLASLGALYWLFFHSQGWLDWNFLRELAKTEGRQNEGLLTVLFAVILTAVFCLFVLFFNYLRRTHEAPVSLAARRPVLCLLTGYAAVLAAAALLPLNGMGRLVVWTVIAVTGPYLWYFAYALKDASAKSPDGVILQFGALRPFWGGTVVPYPKGAANLRKIEVRNSRDLSILQLKAIKLLIWVRILKCAQTGLQVFVYGDRPSFEHSRMLRFMGLAGWHVPNLGIPELAAALQSAAIPVAIAWASVIAHFAQAMLEVTASGGIVIACCRIAGFYALRNTYRPLEAQTVAEFWNRYYYYFKELLVDFFFFPTFTRYFKRHLRFRLFAATIAAATVGNMIYHFLRDYRQIAAMGLWRSLAGFRVYAFYCTLLGLGIGISQLRGHRRERLGADAKWWRKVLATTGVLSFFCLLEIFDQEGRSYGLGLYLRFFLRLFLIRI